MAADTPPAIEPATRHSGFLALLSTPDHIGFSARVRHRGGMRSAAGRELQDQYAAHQIARLFWRSDRRAIRVTVERAGDIDVLALTEDGALLEEYHQVKSRTEALARWTVGALRDEGVWREFITIAAEFAERSPAGRGLQLVFATDGELNDTLVHVREHLASYATGADVAGAEERGQRAAVRGELLAALAGGLMAPADERAVHERLSRKRWLALNTDIAATLDRDLSWHQATARRVDAGFPPGAAAFAEAVMPALGDLAPLVARAVETASRHLDFVLRSLRFESRIGVRDILDAAAGRPITEPLPLSVLERAVVLDLARDCQLDAASAERAYRELRSAVDDATLSSQEFTADTARARLGLNEPIPGDEPPAPIPDGVERAELVAEVLSALARSGAVWLVGAPRVGKTELARQALDASGDLAAAPSRAIWLVPAGEPDDPMRFWLQLAGAVAEHTGNREWYAALSRGGPDAVAVRRLVLTAAAEHRLVLVLDRTDALSDASATGVFAMLGDAYEAGVRVIGIARVRAAFASAAPPVMRDVPSLTVGGLTTSEAEAFWRTLGKQLTEPAAAELIGLSLRVGGHPEVLRLAAARCGPSPSPDEIAREAQALPGGGAEAVVAAVADQLFRHAAVDPAVGALLSRIAVLHHGVDMEQARAVARAGDAPLRWSPLGWARLTSTVLEPVGRGRYRLPSVYQEVARMELMDDPDLQASVRRAAGGVLLAGALSKTSGGSSLTIHWADARDAASDFALARAWGDAAYPAFLLVRAFFGVDGPPPASQDYRALADDLWLTLVGFRTADASAAGVPADVHAMILGGLYRLERILWPDAPPEPQTLGAMEEIARRPGPPGERAAVVVAVTLAGDAIQRGDWPAAAIHVEPAWRQAVERGDAETVRALGGMRVSARAAIGADPDAVLEQLAALRDSGAPARTASDLLGDSVGPDPVGALALAYHRPLSARPDRPAAELLALYELHLAAFRENSFADGELAVGGILALLYVDVGRADDGEALSARLVGMTRGSVSAEVRALASRGDFFRITGDPGQAAEAYTQAGAIASRSCGRERARGRAQALHALRELGRLHETRGGFREALRAVQRAYGLIATHPEVSPQARFAGLGAVAVALFRAGRYGDAALCSAGLLNIAQAMPPENASPEDRAAAATRYARVGTFARHVTEVLTPAEPPAQPTTPLPLALDFFERSATGPGDALTLPELRVVAGEFVSEALAAASRPVCAETEAMRALDACRSLALVNAQAARHSTLRLMHRIRDAATARAGAAGPLDRAPDVQALARVIDLLASHGREWGDAQFLDHYLLPALDHLRALPPPDARALVDRIRSWSQAAVGPAARAAYLAACEVAQAEADDRDGDSEARASRLDEAAAGFHDSLAETTFGIGRVRLDTLVRPPDTTPPVEVLKAQLSYAESLVARGAVASWFGREFGDDLVRYWTMRAREGAADESIERIAGILTASPVPTSLVGWIGRLFAIAETLALPVEHDVVLGAWVLDEGLGELQLDDAVATLLRHARGGARSDRGG